MEDLKLVVYSKQGCTQCKMTKDQFAKRHVEFEVRDETTQEDVIQDVKDLGYQAFPLVVLEDSQGVIVDAYTGFQPQKMDAFKAKLGV